MRFVVPASVGVLANDSDPDVGFPDRDSGDGPGPRSAHACAERLLHLHAGDRLLRLRYLHATARSTPSNVESAVAIVTMTVKPGEAPVSTVRPVVPATLHRMSSVPRDFMGEPFIGNRRLALIEDGTVPCVEVDTMEVTRCVFQVDGEFDGTRRLARSSGDWLEGADGLPVRGRGAAGDPRRHLEERQLHRRSRARV